MNHRRISNVPERRNGQIIPVTLVTCLLMVTLHSAGAQEVDLYRSGLLYGMGTVEQVSRGSAIIDVGQAQTLKVDDRVVLIRQVSTYYVPVGVLPIRETYPTFSRTGAVRGVAPQENDIVLFVREFQQIRPARQYESDLIRQRMIQNSGTNRSSSRRRLDAAMSMLEYRRNFGKWEKSNDTVVGYLAGASFAGDRRKSLDVLLSHIGMMREVHRGGYDGLAAAGPGWEAVVKELSGPTVLKAYEEAKQAAEEAKDEFTIDDGPSIRDIRRTISSKFYDRLDEEKNLFSFLVASILEISPRNEDFWFQRQIGQSQFPGITEEEVVREQLQIILQELRGEL